MTDSLQPDNCSRWLKALSEPDRLRIIQCLRQGQRNVSQLAKELGIELANVSHHLGVLRNAGLVQDQRDGKFVIYHLHPDFYRPTSSGDQLDVLDFGCCRLELGEK